MTITKIAKITSTFLGVEDHGILTAMLYVDYGGSSLGLGGYALDDRPKNGSRERCGTAFGMEWVRRTLVACGVDSWEKVAGRTILVHFDTDEWSARPIGIGPLPTERGKPFIFEELRQQLVEQLGAAQREIGKLEAEIEQLKNQIAFMVRTRDGSTNHDLDA